MMIEQPTLVTERLVIRPIDLSDAPDIQRAAGAREISDTMISIPHPYPPGEADRFVARHIRERAEGVSVAFTIERKKEKRFWGLIEIRSIDREHSHAELSFWLSVAAWGRGYMSEVLYAVLRYGFEDLQLNRFYAYHMMRNPACGRVLEKNGFTQEGLLRQCVRKWGQFEDVAQWAILRKDWDAVSK